MNKTVNDNQPKSPECSHSPDGYHNPQKHSLNTVPACKFCGKVL